MSVHRLSKDEQKSLGNLTEAYKNDVLGRPKYIWLIYQTKVLDVFSTDEIGYMLAFLGMTPTQSFFNINRGKMNISYFESLWQDTISSRIVHANYLNKHVEQKVYKCTLSGPFNDIYLKVMRKIRDAVDEYRIVQFEGALPDRYRLPDFIDPEPTVDLTDKSKRVSSAPTNRR